MSEELSFHDLKSQGI